MINSDNSCTENDGSCKNCRFINNYPDCYYESSDRFDDFSDYGFEPTEGRSDENDYEEKMMRALKNGEGDKLGF